MGRKPPPIHIPGYAADQHHVLLLLTGYEVEDEEEEEDEDNEGDAMETEEAMKHDQLTAFLEQMELQYHK